ncbi:MAG: hypothetical protein QOF85_404 [Solirubrobacterales bacterium]|nr:hypothetical protein [Solirubrobacterales bacterium]
MDVKPADLQFVDLELADRQAPDAEPANRKAADCSSPNCERSNRRRTAGLETSFPHCPNRSAASLRR